ncbi:4'-phosphopantetheinyl transferase family protein [Bacillota bacterium Meth-B3]
MKLYALNVRWLYEERVFFRLLAFLGDDRRRKALLYRFAKDRALSLGAGLILNLALIREEPELPWPPRIRLGGYGKPFLADKGAPSFNLSHSGEYAVCAIGREGVGVDIEQIGIADPGVARRCFVERELLRVMPDGIHVDAEEFCRLWTLKESFIKRIGTGLSSDPLRFEILGKADMRVRQDYDAQSYRCRLYEEVPGYKLALCITSDGFPDRVEIIEKEELLSAIEGMSARRPSRSPSGNPFYMKRGAAQTAPALPEETP